VDQKRLIAALFPDVCKISLSQNLSYRWR